MAAWESSGWSLDHYAMTNGQGATVANERIMEHANDAQGKVFGSILTRGARTPVWLLYWEQVQPRILRPSSQFRAANTEKIWSLQRKSRQFQKSFRLGSRKGGVEGSGQGRVLDAHWPELVLQRSPKILTIMSELSASL
ncbi:hypothetical protein RB213_002594 [Colletotrichum asianum]